MILLLVGSGAFAAGAFASVAEAGGWAGDASVEEGLATLTATLQDYGGEIADRVEYARRAMSRRLDSAS